MPKRGKPNTESEAATRPFWSGTITFGLVSVPVNLYPANRDSRVAFRMIGPSGNPLSRRYFSGKTGRELDKDDIVRGYEFEKNKYVVVKDEELERLEPERSRDIELRLFVPKQSITPLYFRSAYFLTPAGNSVKAYRLLAETMEQTGRAGVGRFVMRGNEYLVTILSENKILRAETLRYPDELRTPDEIGLPAKPKKLTQATVTKFKKTISADTEKQLPREAMKDSQSEKLLKLVERKRKQKKDIVEASQEDKPKGQVIDLMEVLKQAMKPGHAAK